jgi:hypothetical protein
MRLRALAVVVFAICVLAGTQAEARGNHVMSLATRATCCLPTVPVVACCDPCVVCEPVAIVRTRYRPLLGRAASRFLCCEYVPVVCCDPAW